VKGKSLSTLRRKRIETFTLLLLTPPLFMLRSLEGNVTSTSHPNAFKDVPTTRKGLMIRIIICSPTTDRHVANTESD